jgi:dimeric dUTPase (all-alpha-NTP-PPase superfamily)
MNLNKLFQMQKKLDDHIMDEHPELKGQNNLDWKILALLVELGECANEWRGFKKWSKDQEPRLLVEYDVCHKCDGLGFITDDDGALKDCDIDNCVDGELTKKPLLEEYVDGLHFILSIGLELSAVDPWQPDYEENITEQFRTLYFHISRINEYNGYDSYEYTVSYFLGLGEMLGFTWKQIEQAYLDKNAVNHQRQESGY